MNILLLDAYNLIYRARYSGMNKGDHSTVFNFFRGIRPLVEKFKPDMAYFVLEGMPKTRLSLDPNYKGQRTYDNKDGFNEQRKQIISIMKEFFPVQTIKHEDYECDDVIGHLAETLKKENNVTIISSDTDFIQCIDENVHLYNPVRKKFLESPDYDYVLWKSLKGDASDNIIGFLGIGDKKAQKLCDNKDQLDKFLLEEGRKEKLQHNITMIKLHDLSSVEDSFLIHPMPNKPNWEKLRTIFESMDFQSMSGKDTTWKKYIDTFQNLFQGEEKCQA